MDDIAILRKRRAFFKGNMTMLQTFVNAINNTTTVEDIKVRLTNVIYAFIKNFIHQPSVITSTSTHVRRLLDTSDEIIRGLKALGEDAELRDHWLIHIMIGKLDDETASLWAQTSAEYDLPTIQQLFDFLSKRSDALESIKGQNRRAEAWAHKLAVSSSN